MLREPDAGFWCRKGLHFASARHPNQRDRNRHFRSNMFIKKGMPPSRMGWIFLACKQFFRLCVGQRVGYACMKIGQAARGRRLGAD